MDGCGYCEKFERTWNKLVNNYNKKIKFMKINGPDNTRMSKKYKINSYPTLVLIKNKSFKIFKNKRTYENLKQFIIK